MTPPRPEYAIPVTDLAVYVGTLRYCQRMLLKQADRMALRLEPGGAEVHTGVAEEVTELIDLISQSMRPPKKAAS